MSYVRNQKYEIESLLRGYYIKYDRLLELNTIINGVSKIQNPESIDIYIDLFDMLKPIYTTDVYANNTFSICASVINLAAHLRGYYISRHRLWSRIFLVYGEDSTNNHKQFYQEFGTKTFDGAINYESNKEFIESQLELVHILGAYINELYFVKKKTDFCMFTYDNILKNENRISIIVTKSKYAYQIPAMTKETYLFRPKKVLVEGATSDSSYVVYFNNALTSNYQKTPSVLDKICKLNPQLLSLFLTMNGCPEKNVAGMANISRTTKAICSAVESNKILNGYNSDMNYVYDNVIVPNNLNYIDNASFDYRFKAIDVPYQHMIYTTQAEALDNSWLIDLRDPDTVRSINNQYFIDNPLDLNNL